MMVGRGGLPARSTAVGAGVRARCRWSGVVRYLCSTHDALLALCHPGAASRSPSERTVVCLETIDRYFCFFSRSQLHEQDAAHRTRPAPPAHASGRRFSISLRADGRGCARRPVSRMVRTLTVPRKLC